MPCPHGVAVGAMEGTSGGGRRGERANHLGAVTAVLEDEHRQVAGKCLVFQVTPLLAGGVRDGERGVDPERGAGDPETGFLAS
jgi:hypothetical protein